MFAFKKGNEKKLEGKALFYLECGQENIEDLGIGITLALPVHPAIYAGQKSDLEAYTQEFPLPKPFDESHTQQFEVKTPNFWYIPTHFLVLNADGIQGDIINSGSLGDSLDAWSFKGQSQIKDRLEYLATEYMKTYVQQQREDHLRATTNQTIYTKNIKNCSPQEARTEFYSLIGHFLDARRNGDAKEEQDIAGNFCAFSKGSPIETTVPYILVLAKKFPENLEAISACVECMVAAHEGDTTRAYGAFEKLKQMI